MAYIPFNEEDRQRYINEVSLYQRVSLTFYEINEFTTSNRRHLTKEEFFHWVESSHLELKNRPDLIRQMLTYWSESSLWHTKVVSPAEIASRSRH